MSEREKLIALLEGAKNSREIFCSTRLYCSELIADHLISNGVTLQNWIPVSERLPEDDSHVLVARKNGDVDTDMYIKSWWKVDPAERRVTHWMPLPEPPKECE